MRDIRSRKYSVASVVVLTILVLAVATMPAFAGLMSTTVSGLSPYPDGGDPTACNGAPQTGVLYRNSEAEPHLAVNPTNPDNMIAAWHQDRWSNGGAQGVGAAYTFGWRGNLDPGRNPLHTLLGGQPGSAGDYERASDPWVSFSPDGTAHYMALVVNSADPNANGMTVASSSDGGVTWTDPVAIKTSPAQDPVAVSPFHDKNTLTADPFDPDLVYATWTLFRRGNTSLIFSRSTDGGKTWKTRPVNNFEVVTPADLVVFRQGAQIVVLPDGTLVNAFFRILFNPSTNQVTWNRPSSGRVTRADIGTKQTPR